MQHTYMCALAGQHLLHSIRNQGQLIPLPSAVLDCFNHQTFSKQSLASDSNQQCIQFGLPLFASGSQRAKRHQGTFLLQRLLHVASGQLQQGAQHIEQLDLQHNPHSSPQTLHISNDQHVPQGPGTMARLHRTGHLAARHHLQQYLASIDRSGFVDELAQGVLEGNRLAISRSLTLCESTRPDHAMQAAALLRKLIDNRQRQGWADASNSSSSSSSWQQPGYASTTEVQHGDNSAARPVALQAAQSAAELDAAGQACRQQPSLRIGLSGPPGAGKSSLIETWGCYLADHGSRVAVLAVDPSSAETGGAILGDKTRMARLSSHPNAFVRPSPARGTLGGVSRATYDAMVICEAAGYDKVLVETVGVGQSEVAVADLVDCMLLVMPPVGGDDLQMIKRGIMEVADVVLVNKADGHTEQAALQAVSQYNACVNLMPHRYHGWSPQVLAVSAHTGKGVPALARLMGDFQEALRVTGELDESRVRRAEAIAWLSLEEQLLEGLRHDQHVRYLMARLMPWVKTGKMAPRSAADITLSYFYQHCA